MSMQQIRNLRAENAARVALEWIAAARSNFGYWDAEDFEAYARECAARAAVAVQEMRAAESTRRR